MKILLIILLTVSLFCFACHNQAKHGEALTPYAAEHIIKIETGNTTPDELVNFACSLAGTPYKYGSKDVRQGFDCSGYVTYVFILTISASGCRAYRQILRLYNMPFL